MEKQKSSFLIIFEIALNNLKFLDIVKKGFNVFTNDILIDFDNFWLNYRIL